MGWQFIWCLYECHIKCLQCQISALFVTHDMAMKDAYNIIFMGCCQGQELPLNMYIIVT